jgi:4-amino-4-deoxy-L-arabinose transferase-like glycosyltransferase
MKAIPSPKVWMSSLQESHVRMLRRFLPFLIIIVFCFNIYPSLMVPFDYYALEQRYKNWMADPSNLNLLLGDHDLYAYAGWKYAKGASPDEINFEHPPLAKYLIGLSILVFNNPNVPSVVLGILSLLVLYELSKKLFGASLFALVPMYMLSLERIFIQFSSTSMLDIYLVFFLLLSALLLFHADSSPRLVVGAIALGLATACKLTAALAVPSLAIGVIWNRKNSVKSLLGVMLVAALTYCVSYTQFFLLGHSLTDFFELQWKMLMFQFGRRYGMSYPAGRLLLTLLTGIVGPETHNVIFVDEVSRSIEVVTTYGLAMAREFNPLTWPLSFSGSIIAFCGAIRWRKKTLLEGCVFFFSFLLPFSFGQGFVWYFLPAFPIGFLLLTSVLRNMYQNSSGERFVWFLLIYLASLLVWQKYFILPSFVELHH